MYQLSKEHCVKVTIDIPRGEHAIAQALALQDELLSKASLDARRVSFPMRDSDDEQALEVLCFSERDVQLCERVVEDFFA